MAAAAACAFRLIFSALKKKNMLKINAISAGIKIFKRLRSNQSTKTRTYVKVIIINNTFVMIIRLLLANNNKT